MNFLKKVYSPLEKVSDIMQLVIELITGLLIAVCAVVLFYQVLYRFIIVKIISYKSPFTEELSRYSMIWAAYLAIALCCKDNNMPSLNLLSDAIKNKSIKLALYLVTRATILVFLYYGIKFGYAAILNNKNFISPVMLLPGIVIYSSPFVACVLLAFETLVDVLGVLCGEQEPFTARKSKVVNFIMKED